MMETGWVRPILVMVLRQDICGSKLLIFHTNPGDEFSNQSVPRALWLETTTPVVGHSVQRVSERCVFGQRLEQVDQITAILVLVVVARVDVRLVVVVVVVTW